MKVSACIITYNQEHYIAQCLESVLAQVVSFDYEIVIGEDKSTDGTLAICREYALKYPDKIKLIERETNLGMVGNWMSTIESCNGKYIAICEGDDYWTDYSKLQKQVDFMELNSDHVICGTYIDSLTDDGLIETKKDLLFESQDFYGIVKNNKIKTLTALFRNVKITLPENVNFADMALLFELTKNGGQAAILPFKSAVYRIHSGGVYSSQNFMTLVQRGFDDIMVFLKNNPENLKFVFIYSKIYLFKSSKEFVRGVLRRPNSDIRLGFIYLKMFYKMNKLNIINNIKSK